MKTLIYLDHEDSFKVKILIKEIFKVIILLNTLPTIFDPTLKIPVILYDAFVKSSQFSH